MKKSAVIAIVIGVVVLIGIAALVVSNHKSSPTASTTSTTSNMDMSKTQTAPSPASPSPASNQTADTASHSVTIDNFAFSPSNLTVPKNTTVTWTNKDSTTHTVTEIDDQRGPNSGDLATGKSYSFTFDTPGTFKYHCTIHPNMTGTITVTE